MTSATPYVFSSTLHAHLTPYLAALHAHCVTHDEMVGTFRTPLSHEKLLAWWKDRIAEVNAGTRMILILLDESEPGAKAKGNELKGVVLLAMPPVETSPHCAAVEMLLVQADYRRRGAARNLVTALEFEAHHRGKALLVSYHPPPPLLYVCLACRIDGAKGTGRSGWRSRAAAPQRPSSTSSAITRSARSPATPSPAARRSRTKPSFTRSWDRMVRSQTSRPRVRMAATSRVHMFRSYRISGC